MNISNQNFINKLNSLVIKSLLYEVSCYPSPGLVSPISSGAHNDMDYYTFIDSIAEISSIFSEFLIFGMSDIPESDLLSKIRPIGLKIEKSMYAVTNNINTYKGLIFLLGITYTAVSRAFYKNLSFSKIPNLIQNISLNLVENDLKSRDSSSYKTYGEKIFFKYGISGIRGEVEKGLPTVFNCSLPFYRKYSYLPNRQRLFLTLTYIMSICKDSTILHRHDLSVLNEVNLKSKKIINSFTGKNIDEIQSKLEILDIDLSERKISPGGCADLLAITVFLDGIQEYFNI